MGRPRLPRTDSEKAEVRRNQVRHNVQAFRQRQKQKQQELQHVSSSGTPGQEHSETSTSKSSPQSVKGQTANCSTTELSEDEWSDLYGEPWTVQPLEKLDLGPAFRDVFIASLQYRSLPQNILPFSIEYDPDIRISLGCSTWVSSVSAKATPTGMDILNDALLASALTIISKEKDDRGMAMYGAYVHGRALHRLRKAFARFSAGKFTAGEVKICPTMLAMGALTCSMSELLANRSWDKFAAHLQGIGALIEHAGPAALSTVPSRDHFYGYRSMAAPFCFIYRHPTFLSKSEWINFSWKKQYALANHPLHTLLDVALQVPAEMEKFDQDLRKNPNRLCTQLRRLRKIASQLDSWELDLEESCGGRIYSTRPTTWPGLHTESFEFCEFIVAAAFTFYTGVRVQLFNLIRAVSNELILYDDTAKIISDLAKTECLVWSRSACQCFEFFYAGNRKIMGKLTCLVPFDAAWETFVQADKEGEEMTRELNWCKTTAERVTAMGLSVLKWRSDKPRSRNVEPLLS
jgi:hypothetical protein